MLFASNSSANLLTVFLGASLALVLSTAVGVAVGGVMAQYLDPKYLSYAAGAGFIMVGTWTIWQA